MVIEILILVSVVVVFVIFARHLPEIKSKLKDVNLDVVKSQDKPKKDINIFKNDKKKEDQEKKFFWENDIDKEINVADEYLKNGENNKAEKEFVKLAAKYPRNPKIYNRLGVLYLEQSLFEDAKEAFREAIKIDEKIGSRWYNLALAQIGLKEYRSAINSLVKAVKLEKDNKKYLETLKDVRARLKKIKPIRS